MNEDVPHFAVNTNTALVWDDDDFQPVVEDFNARCYEQMTIQVKIIRFLEVFIDMFSCPQTVIICGFAISGMPNM